VHPKTGKVCVPIDPEAAWEFDPEEVPTVQQLVQELAEQQAAGADNGGNKVREAVATEKV
jgi:DNA primase small subunit